MPVKEQGFSLLEVLIAMAISSVLLLGAARFLPALQRESLTNTRKLALEDEIWLRVFTVAKHLQRAGYCHGSCTGEGLEIVGQGDCVIVQWDANSNGIWDREPVKESDQIGFRLKEHVLETLRGATSCEGKGWDKVTNPDAIIIDTFQVVRQDVSGFSPVLTVNMHAASKADPQTVVALVLMLLILGSLLLQGMSQQDRSFASRVSMESQSLRRQAIVQSALEWGKMHSWQTQPAVQCLLYAATGARVCLRLLADNEALLIAGYEGVSLWRTGEVIDGNIVFSPRDWSDFCPLKERALCQLP